MGGQRAQQTRDLSRFAYLSIAAAVVTITLKTVAWQVTGSVGLLSDAAESVVNLVAAIAVLVALKVAAMPADKNHHYGHTKAEYFSAAIEGMMIFVAALVIMYTAVERFLNPRPIDNVGIGLAISVLASVVNGGAAVVLLRAGRRYRSLTLTADGKHLNIAYRGLANVQRVMDWVTQQYNDPQRIFACACRPESQWPSGYTVESVSWRRPSTCWQTIARLDRRSAGNFSR